MQTLHLFLFSNFSLFFFLLQSASFIEQNPQSVGYKKDLAKGKPQLGSLVFFILAGFCTAWVLAITALNSSSVSTSLTILSLFLISIVSYRFLSLRVAPWLGSIMISLILMLQFFLKATPYGFHLSKSLADGLLNLHILISILGQALSLFTCILALALIRQQRNLKSKRLKEFSRGPGLTKIDRLLMQSLQLGLYLYSAALFTGALMAQTLELGDQFRLGWKTIWALSVWLSYLIILQSRHVEIVSSRKMAILSFVSMSILIVIFFVLQFGFGSGA